MGMSSSDDEAAIYAEWSDLQEHLKRVSAAERLDYERMSEDQKAIYEASVRTRNRRGYDR